MLAQQGPGKHVEQQAGYPAVADTDAVGHRQTPVDQYQPHPVRTQGAQALGQRDMVVSNSATMKLNNDDRATMASGRGSWRGLRRRRAWPRPRRLWRASAGWPRPGPGGHTSNTSRLRSSRARGVAVT